MYVFTRKFQQLRLVTPRDNDDKDRHFFFYVSDERSTA